MTEPSPPPPPCDGSTPSLHRRRTLYLVRHGEAIHNVKEKEAQAQAKIEAQAQGLSDTETKERMESARQAVLHDPTLFDAKLTDLGKQQAQQAATKLLQIIEDGIAPPPSEAMVSPLTRCIQTMEIILQEQQHQQQQEELNNDNPHKAILRSESECTQETLQEEEEQADDDPSLLRSIPQRKQSSSKFAVHIRPEIIERQTHYPPDTPQTPDQLFHWTQQRILNAEFQGSGNSNGGTEYKFQAKALTGSALAQEESRTQLRERASKLFDVLMEMKHRHVLIVSHKGYLREMERGLLGLTDSPLFDNAEVRVYRVVFTKGQRELESLERLV